MFVVELIFPWLIFVPARFRRTRMAACAGLVFLQLLIGLTGNYGFFSVLSIALCLTLIDARPWARILPPVRLPLTCRGADALAWIFRGRTRSSTQ